MPDNDGERKAAHDNPLAIEHLEERRHKPEETKEKKEEVGKEVDEKDMRYQGDKKDEKEYLDEEPDVALVPLHVRAAAVRWAEARHCRGFFNTSTHGESS